MRIKTTALCYLTVARLRDWRAMVWVFLAQGCSQGVGQAGLLVALVGLENLLPERVPHMAVDKRPPFLATWAAQVSSQQGSRFPPEQMNQEKARGMPQCF